MPFRTLAILLVLVGGQSEKSQLQPTPVETIRLTLARQTPWQGEDGWCAFGVDARANSGGMSWRCSRIDPRAPAVRPDMVRHRALTAAEAQTLRRLYEAARLFDGGHVGADLSASDIGFEMLIVRTDHRAVALVTFGNPTFSSGPRKALIDWMRRMQMELLKAPETKGDESGAVTQRGHGRAAITSNCGTLGVKGSNVKPKNTICLWFDKDAHAAARFYAATFPNSQVTAVHEAPGDYPSGKKGDVLTVEFTVVGIPCLGLNGGPQFKHNEAFSFQIATDTQEETDRYWNAIVGNGGQESACGWCKDRWGLSWQITPRALTDALAAGGAEAQRAFQAMMPMKKIDIATIEAARRG